MSKDHMDRGEYVEHQASTYPTLVSFRGGIGAGKSAAANHLFNELGYIKISFADPLKVIVFDKIHPMKTLLPHHFKVTWINQHKAKVREMLQIVGYEDRAKDENFWVYQWEAKTRTALSQGHRIVVDDCRYENEIFLIRQLGGVHLYITSTKAEERLLNRDGIVTKGIEGHESEALSKSPYGCAKIITNDGTLDELYEKVEEALPFSWRLKPYGD